MKKLLIIAIVFSLIIASLYFLLRSFSVTAKEGNEVKSSQRVYYRPTIPPLIGIPPRDDSAAKSATPAVIGTPQQAQQIVKGYVADHSLTLDDLLLGRSQSELKSLRDSGLQNTYNNFDDDEEYACIAGDMKAEDGTTLTLDALQRQKSATFNRALIDQYDVNKDGTLTFNEVSRAVKDTMAWHRVFEQTADQKVANIAARIICLRHFDVDGDGKCNKTEYDFFMEFVAQVGAKYIQVNKRKDGSVSSLIFRESIDFTEYIDRFRPDQTSSATLKTIE